MIHPEVQHCKEIRRYSITDVLPMILKLAMSDIVTTALFSNFAMIGIASHQLMQSPKNPHFAKTLQRKSHLWKENYSLQVEICYGCSSS